MRTQWILLSLNLLATPLLWTGPAWSAPAIPEKWPERAVVSGLDGSAVRFSVPDGGRPPGPLELAPLGIREPQWIGVLDSEAGKPPYLLVSGLSSESPERAVFLVRADGRIRPQRVTLPGRLLDPKNRELVFESRLFFGRCLGTQKYDAIVSYQRERLDRKRGMQSSVYIAEASPTMLDERLMERSLPSIRQILLKVRTRQCREIEGRNRIFDARFFNLNYRRGAEDKDKDNDEDDGEDDAEKS